MANCKQATEVMPAGGRREEGGRGGHDLGIF